MTKWRYRHLSDGNLLGLYCLKRIAERGWDGIQLSNHVLQDALGVERIYDERLARFSRSLAHLFPFRKRGFQQGKTLLLGLKKGKTPENAGWMWNHPGTADMEKEIGVDIVNLLLEERGAP